MTCKHWLPGLIRRLIAYTLVIGLPLVVCYVLHTTVSIYSIAGIAFFRMVLMEIGLLSRSRILTKISGIISVIFSSVFAGVLLIAIIITPYSAYAWFFKAISLSAINGSFIANLFVMLVLFFSLYFCTALVKDKSYKALPGLAAILAGIFLVIYQTPLLYVILLAMLAVYILLVMRKRTIPLALVFVISSLLSLGLYCWKPEPPGSALVDQVFYPGLRQAVNTLFPALPLLLDVPGYGLGYGTAKLGGSTLLTSTPVFEVTSDKRETLYLRTGSYDFYTGDSWVPSEKTEEHSVEAADDLPLNDQPVRSVLSVKILTEAFLSVPLTEDTFAFSYNSQFYPVDDILRAQGIVWPTALEKNQTIRLYRASIPFNETTDPHLFLQLPGSLPLRVRELAQQLRGASQTETLENIKEFLAINNTYNVQAPLVREKEDFADKFLFDDKRGYCTHFATAFIILARINNIPARYAQGFLVPLTTENKAKIVTARTAHAWAEILTPGSGWVIWEATQVVSPDFYNRYAFGFSERSNRYRYLLEGQGIAGNNATLRQLQEMMGIELLFKKSANPNRGLTVKPLLPYLTGIGIGLFACGLLVGFFLIFRQWYGRTPSQKVNRMIFRIVKKYKAAPFPGQGGWVHWHKQLCAAYNIQQSAKLLAVILKAAYSCHKVSDEDFAFLKEFRKCKVIYYPSCQSDS